MALVNSSLDNHVASIAFNRPDALNAFTPELLTELVAALADAERNARVVILEGEGRAFSAGVDLKVLQGIEPKAGRVGDVFDGIAMEAASAIRNLTIPVIAKVHGACFTGALELALHCDFILTTDDTKFGDTHCKWALRPTWGMSQNLARAVGVRRARELTFTARTFSGVDARDWGLANASVSDKAALDALTQERARQIAANSPGAVGANKKLYRLHEEYRPLDEALDWEVAMEFPEITDTAERLSGFGA